MIKRFFDVALSLILIILLSPLFLLIFIVIFISDGSPVIFRQKRIGLKGKIFVIYKFRTMINGIEKKDRDMVRNNETDYRIIKFGRAIRTVNLDELPQLYNILKGDMSFVGPRPDPDYEYWQILTGLPEWKKRISVKPGLTGLAQINGKSNLNPKEKLKYDLIYINNEGFFMEFKIILGTIAYFMRRILHIE